VGASAAEYYVSPTALSTGDGSLGNPWPLQTALVKGAAQPGDTVWLRGGTYKGKYKSTLEGNASNPIIVRSYPGEWARIDGNVQLTLVGSISSTASVLTLSDASLMVPGSVIRIDNENIYIKSRTGNTLAVVRGWSSPAASHASGATVRMNGNILTVEGSHTWYWGFEVMSSDPLRITSEAGSAPYNIIRGTGISVFGPYTKLINLVVHDGQEAIGLGDKALHAEVHGCIVYHNGWQGSDRGHGHGLYIQNSTGTKLVSDVISFNNFATGMKAFGVTGAAIGVTFDGIFSFNNGSVRSSNFIKETNLYVGTNIVPADLITIKDSVLYHTPGIQGENLHLGFSVQNNKRISVTNNYIAGGDLPIAMNYWQAATVTGNTIHVSSLGGWSSQSLAIARTSPGYPASAFTWENNRYFDASPAFTNGTRYSMMFNNAKNQLGGGRLAFDEWKATTGYDRNSSYAATDPTGSHVVVRPNRYEQGRGHIAIVNWSRASRVDVSLSNVLQVGDSFEVRDAQNYFGPPVATGIFTGSPVSIPMNLTAMTAPVGNVPTVPTHTAPLFGVFVVSKSSGGGTGGGGTSGGVSVTVTPSSTSLKNGGTQQFSASVTGSTNTGVLWSLQPQVGTISSTGLYTAPATLTTATTVTAKATSVADPTKSATATISLSPATSVSVTVTPSSVSLKPSQQQQLTAQVTGSTNTGVTWSLLSAVGSISSTGLYTAPATISGTTTVTAKATSVADPTKSATATISLSPATTSVSVTVTPSSVSLKPSQQQQFTAQVTGSTNTGVTWSLLSAVGSISSTGLYTAPATISSTTTVTAKATSVADPTKSATATITLSPASALVISPTTATVKVKKSQQFTVQTPNVKVIWSLSPQVKGYGDIHQTGLYWAPDVSATTKTVIIKATDVNDPTRYATATVTIVP
jgi:hypothetical protein